MPLFALINSCQGADGNVGIGTTAPGQRLQVGSSGDGSVAVANAWNTFSDIRLKKDLEIIPEALDKLLALHGYYYFWKEGSDESRQVGVIAQEVEAVLPELVKTSGDGIKTVDYPKLTALLIESSKALKAEKDAEVAQLKARADQADARAARADADAAQKDTEIVQLKAAMCQLAPKLVMCN